MQHLRVSMLGSRGIPTTYSGIETALAEVCPRLAQRGHRVIVYADSTLELEGDVFRGVHVRRISAVNTKHLETFTRVTLSLVRELLVEHSDVVHFHALGPAMFSWIPKVFGKKSVVTVHGLDWQREKWGWFARQFLKAGEYVSARFPNATIVVSSHLKEHYDRKYGINTVWIPNGVNIPEIREPQIITDQYGLRYKQYVLSVSRLVPEKGCHYLIEAFKRLDTQMKLVIAGGPGHTESYLRQLREMAREQPNIIFTGFVSGDLLAELYSNAYLYVLPSEIEGLSLSLLEAMAHGLCVVTSDIPENRSVTQAVYGYTFRNRDVDDLARTLSQLLLHPEQVEPVGQAARQHVSENYDWDRIADQLEALYWSVCEPYH